MYFARQLFYSTLKEIVERQNTTRYQLEHGFAIFLYVLYSIRFCYIFLSIAYPNYLPHSEWDLFRLFILSLCDENDYMFGILFMMLFIDGFYFKRGLYFSRTDTLTFEIPRQLYVQEVDTFSQCQVAPRKKERRIHRRLNSVRRSQLGSILPEWIQIKLSKILVWYNCDAISRQKLRDCPIALYPSVSPGLRCQFYVLHTMLDQCYSIVFVVVCIAFNILLWYYFAVLIRIYPVVLWPLALFDMALMIYQICELIHMAIWLQCLSQFMVQFEVRYYSEINCLPRQLSIYLQMNPKRIKYVYRTLERFLHDSTIYPACLSYTNGELWGWIAFVDNVSQIPPNIYLIYRILSQSVVGVKLTLCYVIMCIQVVVLSACLLFLTRINKVCVEAQGDLPRLQALLPRRQLYYKLKYMSLYERLNNDKLIGITIGPFESISYRIVFEIVLSYVAYVLFLFDFFN